MLSINTNLQDSIRMSKQPFITIKVMLRGYLSHLVTVLFFLIWLKKTLIVDAQ